MSRQEISLFRYLEQARSDEKPASFSLEKFYRSVGSTINVPDVFGYIYDYRQADVIHHYGFDKVLGYGSETTFNAQFIVKDLIHPDDRAAVQYLSLIATRYLLEFSKPLPQPFETLFAISYRVRKTSGEYIWVVRRSSSYENDADGVPIRSISFIHPIDFLLKRPQVSAKVIGSPELIKDFDSYILEAQFLNRNDVLSSREMSVLHFLAMGLASSDIADKLFLSKHTVDNHRKNMLHKTGLKNTAELVRFGLENGLL